MMRFRASIYVDCFISTTDDINEAREIAKTKVEEIAGKIPNSFVGDVALTTGFELDREL